MLIYGLSSLFYGDPIPMFVSELTLKMWKQPFLAVTDDLSLSFYKIGYPSSFDERFDINALLPFKLSYPSPLEEKFFEPLRFNREFKRALLIWLKFCLCNTTSLSFHLSSKTVWVFWNRVASETFQSKTGFLNAFELTFSLASYMAVI